MDPTQPNNPPQANQPIEGPQPQLPPQESSSQILTPPESSSVTPSQTSTQPPYSNTPIPPVAVNEYPQQPMTSAQLSTAPKGKKTPIIIAIAVLAAALCAGAVLLVVKKGDEPVSKITNAIKGNDEVVGRTDGTLDLSVLINKQDTIKNQDVRAKLNQQVNLSDGNSYMITSVERNFTSSSRFLKPIDGKELIKINIVVGNRNKAADSYIIVSSFKIRNSAGGLQKPEFLEKDDLEDALTGQDIQPGKQVKGALVYRVDKDEQISALATEDQYENYTTKETITIKSEVSLQ